MEKNAFLLWLLGCAAGLRGAMAITELVRQAGAFQAVGMLPKRQLAPSPSNWMAYEPAAILSLSSSVVPVQEMEIAHKFAKFATIRLRFEHGAQLPGAAIELTPPNAPTIDLPFSFSVRRLNQLLSAHKGERILAYVNFCAELGPTGDECEPTALELKGRRLIQLPPFIAQGQKIQLGKFFFTRVYRYGLMPARDCGDLNRKILGKILATETFLLNAPRDKKFIRVFAHLALIRQFSPSKAEAAKLIFDVKEFNPSQDGSPFSFPLKKFGAVPNYYFGYVGICEIGEDLSDCALRTFPTEAPVGKEKEYFRLIPENLQVSHCSDLSRQQYILHWLEPVDSNSIPSTGGGRKNLPPEIIIGQPL